MMFFLLHMNQYIFNEKKISHVVSCSVSMLNDTPALLLEKQNIIKNLIIKGWTKC